MTIHQSLRLAIRQHSARACSARYTDWRCASREGQSHPMNATVADEKLLDALAASLCCVGCGTVGVEHLVQIEGLQIVAFGWCSACFESIGGEDGYEAILAEVIRQREVVRRN